jgi:hypothetical protein
MRELLLGHRGAVALARAVAHRSLRGQSMEAERGAGLVTQVRCPGELVGHPRPVGAEAEAAEPFKRRATPSTQAEPVALLEYSSP